MGVAALNTREEYWRNLLGLLTVQDLVDTLGVTADTAQSWRLTGTGPRFVKLNRRIYYRLKDVREWIDNNLHERTRGSLDETEDAA